MEPAARKIRLLAVALCFVFILSLPALAERQLGERILSAGSWGADVFELQRELIRAGYEVQATGLFGTQTEAAVIALQLAHGLEPDGRVGPATLAALRSRRRTMEYVVEPGDSLWLIAQRFNTTVENLMRINGLGNTLLRAGQKLQVPAAATYTVQPGDTLGALAARFNTTVAALAAINGIDDPSKLRVGQQILLP